MSLSSRIIVRLTDHDGRGRAVAYGWLYIKQSRVEAYLRESTLVRQAQEISSFISASSRWVDLSRPAVEAVGSLQQSRQQISVCRAR